VPAARTGSAVIETHVREDAILLYGFTDPVEREWFRLLNTVQGVGPRLAVRLLTEPREKAGAMPSSGPSLAVPATRAGAMAEDVLSAPTNLGYVRSPSRACWTRLRLPGGQSLHAQREFHRAERSLPVFHQCCGIRINPLGDKLEIARWQIATDQTGPRQDRHNRGVRGIHAIPGREANLDLCIVPGAPSRADPDRHRQTGLARIEICHLVRIVRLLGTGSLNEPLR